MESSNVDSENIDEDMDEKLRGDAVGDTMYSASFITKTLMKLTNEPWTTKVEEDLCFLWDMTLEKDICEYLLELSYPSLVTDLIKETQENRLIEILIGILANIFSVIQDKNKLDIEIVGILAQVYSEDPLVIVQVMRFIKAVAFFYDKVNFIDRDVFEQIRFILRSSTNTELLTITLDTIAKLTDNCKINFNVICGDIIPDMFTGLIEIKSNNDLGSLDVRTAYVHVMQVICNISSYQDNSGNILLDEIRSYSNLCVTEISHILEYFSVEENLLPLPNELNFYAEAVLYIFEILKIKSYLVIFESICKIIAILLKEDCEEVKLFLKVFKYMVLNGELKDLQDSVSNVSLESFHRISRKIKNNNEALSDKLRLIENCCKKSHKT
ncbi:protein saal1 [Agrilus planipennis]|uniref:Protein saal1 n=1 Tax=Agrilus planipennis TaxID=224129 RepID=A0A1W4WAT0_AGRPL|nr:protein saal1 [Agrilus planipennis]